MRIYYKMLLYWLFLHLVLAGLAAKLLWEDRLWLLLAEAAVIMSLVVATVISRQLKKPAQVMQEGLQLINDNDLGTQFIPTRQAEIRELVYTYNKIIQRLRQERQSLQEKEFFLEKITDASETALLMLDYDGKIAMMNPSAKRLLGSSTNLLGLFPEELPHPFGQALSSLEVRSSAMVILPSRKRVKCTKNEFFDKGFSREFITLDELTEELRQSELAAYDKLIRVISHEINNSLASVNSLLHTCLDYAPQLAQDDREDYQVAMNVMIARTNHLNKFMRNYADIIRIGKPQKRPKELVQLLQNIASLFNSDFKKRKIEVNWQIPKGEHWVNIDQLQFEQALVNIVKNAMEAIGENGEIGFGLSFTDSRQTILSITDTGCGISQEVKDNLFTPFFSTKENGQGIGLTFIQEVMRLHNFPFDLESKKGEKTSFKIWLD